MTSKELEYSRGQWSNKVQYLLSLVGYAVGLGNVWRFPYKAYQNGGAAFVIPYLVMMCICGIPAFMLETSLGQLTQRGPLGVFDSMPSIAGVGWAMIVCSTFICVFYNVVMVWSLFYLIQSLKSLFTNAPLPWDESYEHSVHSWRTRPAPYCNETLTEKYWRLEVIQDHNKCFSNGTTQDGLQTGGFDFLPHLMYGVALSWLMIFVMASYGIKSSGKGMYVTATVPYVILLALFIVGIQQDGAIEGVKYFLLPGRDQWGKMLHIETWLAASTQLFFSLSVGMGGLQTLSSYSNRNNNFIIDTYQTVLTNCGTSILAGVVVFLYLGNLAKVTGHPIETVVSSGPDFAFVVWPRAISTMHEFLHKQWMQNLFASGFFLMLFSLGLSTIVTNLESILTPFCDQVKKLRENRVAFTFGTCLLLTFAGFGMCTRSGVYWVDLLNYYSCDYPLLILTLLELVGLYIYNVNDYCEDIYDITGQQVNIFIKLCWKYITPISLIFILIMSTLNDKSSHFGTFQSVGVVIGSIVLCPVLICFLQHCRKKLVFQRKKRIYERL